MDKGNDETGRTATVADREKVAVRKMMESLCKSAQGVSEFLDWHDELEQMGWWLCEIDTTLLARGIVQSLPSAHKAFCEAYKKVARKPNALALG